MRNNQFKLLVMSLLSAIFITGCSVQAEHYRHSPGYYKYRGHDNRYHRDNGHHNDYRRDNGHHGDYRRDKNDHGHRN